MARLHIDRPDAFREPRWLSVLSWALVAMPIVAGAAIVAAGMGWL